MTGERRESSVSQDYEDAVTRRRRLISSLHGTAGEKGMRPPPRSSAEPAQGDGAPPRSPTSKVTSQTSEATVKGTRESNTEPGAHHTMAMDSHKGSAGGADQENTSYSAILAKGLQDSLAGNEADDSSGPKYPPLPMAPPSTPAVNSQITQAVQFTNFQNYQGLETMISVPERVMTNQSNGHASQNAETYMNGVMQISMAAQAIVAAKIAQDPALAATPALTELNTMVTNAITAFQDVSK